MGDYLDNNKPIGPNVKKLLAYLVARDAIPPGGGLAAGIEAISTPGRIAELSRKSLAFIETALAAVKSAPNNPYGDDDEAIAAEILRQIEAKKPR